MSNLWMLTDVAAMSEEEVRWQSGGGGAVSSQCGIGFLPLDEALGLLPGMLPPQGHACLVRLAGWILFGKAAEMLEDFLGMDENVTLRPEWQFTLNMVIFTIL